MSSLGKLAFVLSFAAGGTFAALAQETQTTEPASEQTIPAAVSQVRIVRLSQVKGEVRMDRNINRGFESTFALRQPHRR